jgi:hypothetical protein
MKVALWDISSFSLVEVASVADVVAAYIMGAIMFAHKIDGCAHP